MHRSGNLVSYGTMEFFKIGP